MDEPVSMMTTAKKVLRTDRIDEFSVRDVTLYSTSFQKRQNVNFFDFRRPGTQFEKGT